MTDNNPMQAGLQALGWDAARAAAALAVAAPNDLRIAQAALDRLSPADHVASFASWCDLQTGRANG